MIFTDLLQLDSIRDYLPQSLFISYQRLVIINLERAMRYD